MEETMSENPKHSDTLDRTVKIEKKVKNWLKDNQNLLLLLLMVLIFSTHIYFFTQTANQPTWWDEGDYLGLAESIAHPPAETPEWWTHFASMRPFLMSIIWAFFIKIGLPESAMRFITVILPSILIALFAYLLGASLFNKRIGLISGYLISIYWVILFYSHRFLTDIPAMLLGIMAIYYFWEYYVKKGKPWGLYLTIFLGVLGFLTRFTTALVIFAALGYLIITQKQEFFTKKTTWIAGIIGVLTLIPWFIYNKIYLGGYFPAATFYGGGVKYNTYETFAWNIFTLVPGLIGKIITVLFLIGIIYALFRLVIGIDLFLKQKDKSLNKDAFLVIWLFLQIFYFVFILRAGTDRWLLLAMPPIFMYAASAIDMISNYLNKYYKYLGIIFIALILIFAGYNNLTHADALTKAKLDSYKEIRDVGLWLKDNTPEDAKILGASTVQTTYYSQRRTYDLYVGNELLIETSAVDSLGRIIDKSHEAIRNETELECKMVRIKPDYLVIHPWEPVFTPQFIFDYPQRNQDILSPIKHFERNGQIMAVIYEFNGLPTINESLVNCTEVYQRPDNLTGISLELKEPSRLIIPS